MTFSEMMEELDNDNMASRPGWGAVIIKDSEGHIIYAYADDTTDDSYHSNYELEMADFRATDWFTV